MLAGEERGHGLPTDTHLSFVRGSPHYIFWCTVLIALTLGRGPGAWRKVWHSVVVLELTYSESIKGSSCQISWNKRRMRPSGFGGCWRSTWFSFIFHVFQNSELPILFSQTRFSAYLRLRHLSSICPFVFKFIYETIERN